jgi:hypothetical protein
MAIENFKNIEDRKGYLVEQDDRKIFEKEIGKSYFGLGFEDTIEFILYDSNDNQLPQGETGRLVRYININDDEAKKYFITSQNNLTKKTNDAPEAIFDIEQLIRDAGYNTGIFKTQITLLNRRAGSENRDDDKLWIHEISPSRTEIRILPIKNTDNPSEDLLRRYELFTTENSQFRDDTIYFAKQYVQNIDVSRIFQNFLRTKGKYTSGEKYSTLIKNEFKVNSLEELFTKIKDKLLESVNYFVEGRVYSITDINYGKPRLSVDLVELSIDQIKNAISNSLFEIIDFYLPKRNIQEKNLLTPEQQDTFDQVSQILKTVQSNDYYESTELDKVNSKVRGCTDPDALNYNPQAEVEDGSCQYSQTEVDPIIWGCTDNTADNYNSNATDDDGSCTYEVTDDTVDETPTYIQVTKTWYVWSENSDVEWKDKGVNKNQSYKEYDEFTITYDENSLKYKGDIREYPKTKQPDIITKEYWLINKTHKNQNTPNQYDANGYDNYGTEDGRGMDLMVKYKDASGADQTYNLGAFEKVALCAQEGSIRYMQGLEFMELGPCGTQPPSDRREGCTNVNAINFDPSATVDDGSCLYSGTGGGSPAGGGGGGNRDIPNPDGGDIPGENRERNTEFQR